jgi:TonB-linked SusC/RagA family outer membrane protein
MKKNLNYYGLSKPHSGFQKLLLVMKIVTITLICSFIDVSANSNYLIINNELQQIKISGKVIDQQTGSAMPGVNISVQNTTIGTNTDSNGNYSISVPGNESVLVFSFIGYSSQIIPVNGQLNINISLVPDVKALNEVVVTALGIEKETKTLTYATQKISGAEILKVKDVDFVNSLAGKVAGAVITKGTQGLGSDTRILIRGDKSFTGNSAPLYVIDGVPAGNGSLLNSEDIESIQILQGASAAALYGSQSANGVILITTKKASKGVSKITFSSSLSMENASDLPKLQTKYGRETSSSNDCWGPVVANGSDRHLKEFFNTGITKINSISVSNGNEMAQIYLSYANTSATSILPENHMAKNNFNIKVTNQLFNDRLSLEGSVNYINQKIYNEAIGNNVSSIIGLLAFPIDDDWSKYSGSNYEVWDPVRQMYVQNWPYFQAGSISYSDQNPYWVQKKNQTDNFLNYSTSSFKAKYKILDWLNLQGRVTYDDSYYHYESRNYASTQSTIAGPNGSYAISNSKSNSLYSDLLLTGNKNISRDINLSGTLGLSDKESTSSNLSMSSTNATSLLYPNYFSIFALNGLFNKSESLIKMSSDALFANATVGYKEKLFLDVTARNEWSSTTIQSFFYPSMGLTYLFKKGGKGLLSFAKGRVSYAEVGTSLPFGIANLTPPYSLDNSGNVLGRSALPYFNGTDTIRLKPERTRSYEAGTDLRFFDDNLSLSLTLYSATTFDQVFEIEAPAGSGATYFWVNGGSIRNQGFEGIVSYNASFGEFKWTPSISFSHNQNQIRNLSNTLKDDHYVIASSGVNGVASLWLQRPKDGKYGSYGDLYGYAFVKDETGVVKTNSEGLPIVSDYPDQYIGNANPDFLTGFNNTFTYKKFTLSFLIDGRFGGGVVNRTFAMLDYKGLSENTGAARDAGGVTFNGKVIDAKDFYLNQSTGGKIVASQYYYDATNIRMRELSLGYTFSDFKKIFKSIDVSLVGRNLFILYKKAPFDPEVGVSASQSDEGIIAYDLSPTRSFGLNLRVNF